MSWRISVDVGGTFTDAVVADDAGALHIGKGLTTPERAFLGVRAALDAVAADLDTTADAILADAVELRYGTTRTTNAIVERRTARTALLTTAGHPDVLLLREGGKPGPFRQFEYSAPYVPRHLTFEIDERVDAEATIARPLDEASVRRAIDAIREAGCEAVAVCLLWSIVEPTHELRIGELLDQHLPAVPYTLSHQLNPVVREYRRASSTAIDASLKPLLQELVRTLDSDLTEAGFTGRLLMTTSFGGTWTADEITQRPIYSIGSGPSMAPIAALRHARAALEAGTPGREDLLVCDTGGTTFDVSLVTAGELEVSADTWLGGRWTGHITGTRSVAVRSVGSGGGSVVAIDPGGLLRVGPRSAGSEPGPACYGRGGELATITDAAVLLGYLEPGHFLGGRLELDVDAAQRVFEPIAAALETTVVEAAAAAMTVADENVAGAVRELTIARGIDPRQLTLVAGGGASGLNVVAIARALGCDRVLLPRTAGALSATGGLFADLVSEFSVVRYVETRDPDPAGVRDALGGVREQAEAFLAAIGSDIPHEGRIEYAVEARYRQQLWELELPLPGSDVGDLTELEERFHELHERTFAVHEPGQSLECLVWKARAVAVLPKPSIGRPPIDGTPEEEPETPAWFADGGMQPTPRLDGERLAAGTPIAGPVVVREPTTTIVVPPGVHGTLTDAGDYLLDLTGRPDATPATSARKASS